ncbi:uncharacterized protein LOC141833172 [Curcuma longa]|uniref:uncharacterized protein LOC141833172 n=1 Tax=Curcuma longa TaxID=136217 RepID=UPI003D9DC867
MSEEPDLIQERDIRDQNREYSDRRADWSMGEPTGQGIPPPMPTSAPTDRSRIMTLAKSAKERFTLFHGGSDPWMARSWLENVMETFEYMSCTEAEMVGLAAYHLRDQALTWWKTQKTILGTQEISWTSFREAFERQFFPATFRMARRQEFLNLKQGERSVMEYNEEFTKLAEFCPQLVVQDEDRMVQFMQGLAVYIRIRMSGTSIHSYREALDRALAIELTQQQVVKEKETANQNVRGKTKGPDSQSTSQKRQKTGQSSGGKFRNTSHPGQKDNKCKRCGLHGHLMADCRVDQRICYYCKNPGHMIRDCALKAQLESTGAASSGGQPTQQPLQRTQRIRGPQQQQQRPPPPQPQIYMLQGRDQPASAPGLYATFSAQHQFSTPVPQSQTQTEWRPSTSQPITQPPSTEVGRVYAITREEAQRADGSVIRGMVSVYSIFADTLIDTGFR